MSHKGKSWGFLIAKYLREFGEKLEHERNVKNSILITCQSVVMSHKNEGWGFLIAKYLKEFVEKLEYEKDGKNSI